MNEEEYRRFIPYVGKEMNYLNAVVRKDKLSWRVGIYSDGEFFCQITDFSNFQKLLPFWCSVCGKETKNKKGYCEEHSKELRREKVRSNVKSQRNRDVIT